MTSMATPGMPSVGLRHADPLRCRPPREGLRRPGTAVGNPQVPF
ncbi:hypothetical protein [Kineosporia sp. NBRC 101731]|nr:hypothetical protein [Kineosporia sp. NBRC 101731]